MAYSKEDVINAALKRFASLDVEGILRPIYEKFYDEKGKDAFRIAASVTPTVMREYYAR